jgi:hypothetical protein
MPFEEKKDSLIIDMENLEFKMVTSPTDMKMKFVADSFHSNIPEEMHFGAII